MCWSACACGCMQHDAKQNTHKKTAKNKTNKTDERKDSCACLNFFLSANFAFIWNDLLPLNCMQTETKNRHTLILLSLPYLLFILGKNFYIRECNSLYIRVFAKPFCINEVCMTLKTFHQGKKTTTKTVWSKSLESSLVSPFPLHYHEEREIITTVPPSLME